MKWFFALFVRCWTAITTPPPAVPPTAPPVTKVTTPPRETAPIHCFAWVHGPDFSTDCYPTPQVCEARRKDMERGSRPTTPCRVERTGSCTMVSRPPSPTETQRCFGDLAACGRYRNYVAGNGLTTTDCTQP